MVLTAAAGIARAATSTSVTWGPVYAYYKNIVRAMGAGSTSISGDRTSVLNAFYLDDRADDGNNVYGHTTFSFLIGNYFYDDVTRSTGEYSYWTTPVTRTLTDRLRTDARAVRAASKVCVQLGWPVPDSCSPQAITTLGY